MISGPAGAFEQDVAFSSTVFRRRNILRANGCSNAAAPQARSVGRRFMPPRTASSILKRPLWVALSRIAALHPDRRLLRSRADAPDFLERQPLS